MRNCLGSLLLAKSCLEMNAHGIPETRRSKSIMDLHHHNHPGVWSGMNPSELRKHLFSLDPLLDGYSSKPRIVLCPKPGCYSLCPLKTISSFLQILLKLPRFYWRVAIAAIKLECLCKCFTGEEVARFRSRSVRKMCTRFGTSAINGGTLLK